MEIDKSKIIIIMIIMTLYHPNVKIERKKKE